MAEKIKLLMLTHNYPRYDGDFAGVFLSLLAKTLPAYDIEPIVLAPHDKNAREFELKEGVKIYRFRYADNENDENIAYKGNMHKLVLGSVSGIFKFRHFLKCFEKSALEIIEKENIDIVAGHWLIPSGIVMKNLAKKYHLPMVMSSHGTDIRLMRKYFKTVYRYLSDFCLSLKGWTVVSSFLKKEIVSLDGRLDKILKVLPMPHDETIFYKDENITRDKNIIVTNTRFTHQKRVDVLIKALALVSEKNPDIRLHIYRMGPDNREITNLIEKLGLKSRIEIYQPVEQNRLRKIYNQAGMVILNSYNEGFGLVLSEAMMCGAPVIGTDSGGITDIIEDQKTGLLVEPDNHQSLAEAIIKLYEDDQLRSQLAKNGYLYACDNFQSKAPVKKYAEIIRTSVS